MNFAYGYDTSTVNISGGVLTNGFILVNSTAKANFVGTGLSFTYQSYDKNNPYDYFSDFFKITGTIGGVMRTVNLYVGNQSGASGTPNSTPRQFTFNGAAVVPEGGTLALLLPALGVALVAVRKRK